jgi:hypothetical protein
MSQVMDEVEPIAEEIAPIVVDCELFQLRTALKEAPKESELFKQATKNLRRLFGLANVVRYYRMGLNPERWLGKTDDVMMCKKIAGLACDFEEQKEVLKKRGYLPYKDE